MSWDKAEAEKKILEKAESVRRGSGEPRYLAWTEDQDRIIGFHNQDNIRIWIKLQQRSGKEYLMYDVHFRRFIS